MFVKNRDFLIILEIIIIIIIIINDMHIIAYHCICLVSILFQKSDKEGMGHI